MTEARPQPELWGGHECTVNRIGDRFRDQTVATGHHDRLEDLSRFAELGIRKLRYPVLWERVAPDHPDQHDWAWSDERLSEIARLGMEPIVGLLHHGSGPRYTALHDDAFPGLFADYAAVAAQRYPHVVDWTPINEPLTTARFSALYGLWYPHARDERLFWAMLLNQVDATRLAMAEIRRINPASRLIQTEDLGEYFSTPALTGVAAHFNDRRWMTWDLLTGRVDRDHPLWLHVSEFGFGDRLRAIRDAPCPPDIIGVNHYVTSERFLDDRLDAYANSPPAEGYHDVTAGRVMTPPPPGLSNVLRQASDRYGLPLAVTESHLGCTREEQLRWLQQSLATCEDLVRGGVDLRGFTAWALLGNMDWNSLITLDAGHYESGAFDVSSGVPRATAVASLLQDLGGGKRPIHPAAERSGWWQRPIRLEHPSFDTGVAVDQALTGNARPILIAGATGTLGNALAGACELRGLEYLLTDRATLPIDEIDRVRVFLTEHRPWAVINAAGWVRVDEAEDMPEGCMRANSHGAGVLARACAEQGIHCTLFSSDLVFDGRQTTPYFEHDLPKPLGIYGESKARAEALAMAAHPGALIVRTAAFFSPHDQHNFAMHLERTLSAGQQFYASEEHFISPTYVPDLVRATLDLVVDGEAGLWHLANDSAVSWLKFGKMLALALGLNPDLVRPAVPAQLGWRAARPAYAALGSTRGKLLPSLADAIERHTAIRRPYAC